MSGANVTTWSDLGEQLRVAIDAAIPDALLGVFADDTNPRSIENGTAPITRPIVERTITALTADDLLQLLVEHPALLEADAWCGWASTWTRRRAIAAGHDPSTAKSVLADVLRTMVERALRKHADDHLAARAAGVVE